MAGGGSRPPPGRGAVPGLAGIAGFALAVAAVPAGGATGAGLWPVRLVLLVLLGGFLGMTTRYRLGRLWLAPLPLLAALTLIFYSLIPALLLAFRFDVLTGAVEPTLVDFSGQPPDALVLLFSALALAAAAGAAAWLVRSGPAVPGASAVPVPPGLRRGLAALATGAAGLQILWAQPALAALVLQMIPPPLAHNLIDGMAPLQAIALMVLLVDAIDSGAPRRLLLAGLLTAGSAGLQVASGIGKFAVYLVAAAALVWLVRSPVGRPAKLIVIAAALMFAVGSLSVISQVRGTTPYALTWNDPARLAAGLAHTLMSKLAQRQYETGACLANVIRQNHAQPAAGSPFYFLEALVPRLIWAGKPDFSPFNAYARQFCGDPTANPQHSASITLLGEPLLRGGWHGLVVALGLLVGTLAVLGVAAARGGPLWQAGLAALLPWLIDFDQNYSLYWANALKMTLYITPVIVVVRWSTAGRRVAASPVSAPG